MGNRQVDGIVGHASPTRSLVVHDGLHGPVCQTLLVVFCGDRQYSTALCYLLLSTELQDVARGQVVLAKNHTTR